MDLPSPVLMLKNKVEIVVDGVRTMGLVDTGATVSVMSIDFKNRLGRKVMFDWDKVVTFRGVGGESLRPLGVCSVNVCFGGHSFRAEFTVLPRTTHGVILGIDFLKQCGAKVDCRNGEVFIDGTALSALVEDTACHHGALCVLEDTTIPARCGLFVGVTWSGSPLRAIDAVVEPTPNNCAKKNVLVPRAAISVVQGQSQLWTVNYSREPVVLPRGLKLAHGTEHTSASIAVLTEESGPRVNTRPVHSSAFLDMINQSLQPDERRALIDVLSKHASVFDFSQRHKCSAIPANRTHHSIHTGEARPIRQKPYRVSPSERRVINEQVQEMLRNGIIRESCSPWAAPVILVKKKRRFLAILRRLSTSQCYNQERRLPAAPH